LETARGIRPGHSRFHLPAQGKQFAIKKQLIEFTHYLNSKSIFKTHPPQCSLGKIQIFRRKILPRLQQINAERNLFSPCQNLTRDGNPRRPFGNKCPFAFSNFVQAADLHLSNRASIFAFSCRSFHEIKLFLNVQSRPQNKGKTSNLFCSISSETLAPSTPPSHSTTPGITDPGLIAGRGTFARNDALASPGKPRQR
jgi:hypothetical protein